METRFDYLKGNNKGNITIPPEEEKLKLNLDVTELDLLCAYVVSDNKILNRNNIQAVKKFMDMLDISQYKNNSQLMEKIDMINRAIFIKLQQNVHSKDLVLRTIAGGLGGIVPNVKDLDMTEILWVNQMLESVISNKYIESELNVGMDIMTRLASSDYANKSRIATEFELWINRVQNKIRKTKIEASEEMSFSLRPNKLNAVLRETHRQITSPRSTLRLGTQALNMLTGGGLCSGRVYVLLGLPSEGKSSTLLDIAIQIKKYNKQYKCSDPSKTPCVLLFTMENAVYETVERMYGMMTHSKLKNVISEDEAINEFNLKGLHISTDDPIDIVIKYRPGMSEDTSYIYKLIDDLNDDGYEVICVIQDYLKRIHAAQGTFNGDFRREIGEIVNEFKVLATIKQIPVVTASQLNREATANIDNARARNKADLVRMLGRANVAESNLIIENSDWIAQIAPEVDKDGNKYLGIQCVKIRYDMPEGLTYAFLPYIPGTIKLMEDIYSSVPVHKTTMMSNDEVLLNNGMSSNIIGNTNIIKSFSEVNGGSFEDASTGNVFRNSSTSAYMNMNSDICKSIVKKKQMCHLVDNTKPYKKQCDSI